jgi:hemolysin activation/secretion protein
MLSSRALTLMGGCAVVAFASAPPAEAQGVAPSLAPGAGSLVVEQQRQERQVPITPAAPAPRPALSPQTGAQAAPTTPLREVRVLGSTRLNAQVGAIAARFAGRPLDQATIKAVADAVSAAYADTGLALYTIAVPRQDLGQGVLTLRAVEGYIAEVSLQGDARAARNRQVLAYVAKLKAQRPLTKAWLERYLSLIRDIPGLTVDAQLYNTPAPGAVRLALTLRLKRVEPNVAINNSGAARLGAAQALASATAYSLARDGDLLRVTGSVAADLVRFQYISGTYVTPLGSDGLTLRADASYLKTRPKDPPIDGEAGSLGLQLAYPLLRSYDRNLTVSGGLDGLNSDNALYGASLTSDHTRAVRAGLVYGETRPRRSVSASLILAQGLEGLGARTDLRLTDADFSKLDLQVGVNQQLGKTVVLRLQGLTQASSGRLPAAEQLPLGGPVFGRAFPQAEIVGDYGYAGSAELGWISPKPWPAALQGSELYVFADGGRTWSRARLPYATAQAYDLVSAGAGVRFLIHRKTVIGLEAAKAVDAPLMEQNRPWRVLVSWKLSR